MGEFFRLHGISDAWIGLACFSIPITLYFLRQHRDAKTRGLILTVEEINRQLRQEIEARNVAEEKLLRYTAMEMLASQDQMHAFFEAASQTILGVDADGRISVANGRTETMFGYSGAELIGQPLEMLLPKLSRSTRTGTGMDSAGKRKDGSEFPVEIGLSNVETLKGPLTFAMVSDLSDLKKTAAELERANQELRRSNIEIEQFAHVASHDLQEPLRMVASYLQLIKRRYDAVLDDDGRQFIDFAVDGATRMKALIRDLLEFSRARTDLASFRLVPAASILQGALDNLQTAIADAGAQITVDPLPTVAVDPVLITQVFQNLIMNAVKFQKDRVPCIHISARRQSSEWIFSVRDNGIGIEQRHMSRIFGIFERLHTSQEYAGSGIGLAITKRIIERHGGKIWVESQTGIGSTFFFSLKSERPEKM